MTETPVRAPAPPGLLYAMADQRRNQLDARELQATAMMRRQLAGAEARLSADLAAVTDLIEATPVERRSPAWLYQQARYRELLAAVEQEMATYGGQAARQVTDAQRWAQQQGMADAAALGAQAAGVRAGDFMATNLANLSTSVGFLADGSPVADLFARYGGEAVANARQVMSNAAALGWGSAKTAREFRRTVTDMTRSRSELVARTELHRVYRATSRDTYAANADVLTGWVWLAKLDNRTCPTCIVMSGTMHPLDETLDGHPRCRCAMVPITGPWQAIDPRLAELKNTTGQVPTGADWLKAQPPATQKAILGRAKYDAYARGQFQLDDLVKRDSDPVWGTMRREATLAETLANAAARARPANRPGLTQRALDAMMPKRGGWDTSRRKPTVEALKATPAGRNLLATLDSFQSGGSTAIPRLRTDIQTYLQGGGALAPGRRDSVENLLGAIANTDAGDRALYRGMRLPGTVDDVVARYAPGSQVDLALASFSSDAKLAQLFSVRGAGAKGGGGNVPVVVEWVEGPKRALPLENLGKSRIFGDEREWLTAGKFTVDTVKVAKRGGQDTVVVRIRQVETL